MVAVDDIWARLYPAVQEFLFRFPLAAASVKEFKYMIPSVQDSVKIHIPNWDRATMLVVEVICQDTPDRDEIEVLVGSTWMKIKTIK